MNLTIKKTNLFSVTDEYYLAHCISADYALGAGIAVEFQKRFHLKEKLLSEGSGMFPDCVLIGRVFNLVTKNKYWNKPSYESLRRTLDMMKMTCLENGISKIAMPKIGCGLDRLMWAQVKEDIEKTFEDTDIEILVCHI